MIQAILVVAVLLIIAALGPQFIGMGIWLVMFIAVALIIKNGIKQYEVNKHKKTV